MNIMYFIAGLRFGFYKDVEREGGKSTAGLQVPADPSRSLPVRSEATKGSG
jgi:hypothetical protein